MRPLSFLDDKQIPLVIDTSVAINLIATGCAATIIEAVPNPMVVTEMILDELERGRERGRIEADRLRELVSSGHIEIVYLGKLGWEHFAELVEGAAVATLDDGEASTIAYSVEQKASAVIDERKAARICGERFPQVSLASTVDILLHPGVRNTLGNHGLGDALFRALQDARMRVFPDHLEAVVQLLGPDQASQCMSLPKHFRSPGQ